MTFRNSDNPPQREPAPDRVARTRAHDADRGADAAVQDHEGRASSEDSFGTLC